MTLSYKWHTSIEKIPKESWDEIFGDKIIKGYEFFKAMQYSNIPNSSFLFLVVYGDSNIIAILPCFTYRLDLGILAPKKIKNIIKIIRDSISSNFLSIKIFGVGSLASTCEQHIGILENLDEKHLNEIYELISSQIISKAKKLKNKLIFVKEVPESQLKEVKKIFASDFYFYYSLPNCIVPTFEETKPFPHALKRKERQRYRTIINKFNSKYNCEVVTDFKDLLPEFTKMYLNTLNRSKNIFEILNYNFFELLNVCLQDKSCMMSIKNRLGRIEALGLILKDKDSIIPLYIGLNYDNPEEDMKILHMYSIIQAIEFAESDNKIYVKLGQTSYYPKVLSGALVEDLYLGFSSYNPIIQFLIKNIFGKLFTQTEVLDNAYRDDLKKTIIEKVTDNGFEIKNK